MLEELNSTESYHFINDTQPITLYNEKYFYMELSRSSSSKLIKSNNDLFLYYG